MDESGESEGRASNSQYGRIDEEDSECDPKDMMNIMVATDNHLGYGEKDKIRENDSFLTFEEILILAKKNDVDFILLGGDLFHESKPSPFTIYKCSELIKKYCFGDKPVQIEFLSDAEKCLRNMSCVNYEDPNLNISYPIFTINGNHDDPVGTKKIAALDLLSSMGMINYFGHWNDLGIVELSPILIRKGKTNLALYGLSHMHDQRLARLFHDRKIKWHKPAGEWLFVLVLHQNYANRGNKNFIPTSALPKFLHLVIWGHEHDCYIDPELTSQGFYVMHPGSSVATSLACGEARKKHVGILKLHLDRFFVETLRLRTVRPFCFDKLTLRPISEETHEYTAGAERHSRYAQKQVDARVTEMIKVARADYDGPEAKVPLPLIRLQVFYTDEREVFNSIRFGQQYVGQVANPVDIIKLQLVKSTDAKKKSSAGGKMEFDDEVGDDGDDNNVNSILDVIRQDYESDEKKFSMNVLNPSAMLETLEKFISTNDSECLELALEYQIKQVLTKLEDSNVPADDTKDELARMARNRSDADDKVFVAALNSSNLSSQTTPRLFRPLDDDNTTARTNSNGTIILDGSDEDDNNTTARPARGRGSRGGKGSRGPRAARGTRGKK